MPSWPDQPWILEINAWTWITGLKIRYSHGITLGSVPVSVWDDLARAGVDGIWLMGVWRRSEMARRISLSNEAIIAECRRSLPDFSVADISGSPYAIAEYVVDPYLGGPEGLAEARRQLASRGLSLLLDYVPNHVAPDHPWIMEHPEYFVRGDMHDQQRDPAAFFCAGDSVIARGRDPYFPPWPDTAQLNTFHEAMRAAAGDTVRTIAEQCDGVRCDMAMLLLNRIFSGTWSGRVGIPPATEFWPDLVGQIRKAYPNFLFIAEAYWDLESDLLQQGFDYCYDKRLYDRLVEGAPKPIRQHLMAPLAYQRRLIRFLENHDEPRAATAFSPEINRIAAVALVTLPGAKLLQDGQVTGAKIKCSVHLGRAAAEPPDEELRELYQSLIELVRAIDLRHGVWQLCEQQGWADNTGFESLVSWCWRVAKERYVVVLNLSDSPRQGRIILPWNDLSEKDWNLLNLLPWQDFGRRVGKELAASGLYVDIAARSFHFMELVALEK